MGARRILSALILAASFAVPAVSYAHNVGQSYTQTVGPYLVDIGYLPVIPQQGVGQILDFKLWDANATNTPAEFSDVIVTIKQGNSILLETSIYRDVTATSIAFIPPVAGQIIVDAQYERGSQTIAHVTFPLTVAPDGNTYGANLLQLLIALTLGLAVGVVLMIARSRYES